ncbi:cyclic peptide export ABC transporter [Cellulosilyticum ruminicola]|uniref:cyclic peptide export ABC transporter n=1 Tax=Cellulosilyticum ruminicola TaxID=425254 RepID=UPI0006D02B78|nr:cyclic peptide export ABC transporter [Cellulosilyticum ruminicola]
MKQEKKKLIKIFIAIICLIGIFFSLKKYQMWQVQKSLNMDERINAYLETKIKDGKIPGMAAVVIRDGKVVLQNEYGYADVEKKIPVTSQTLFEIGSCSKSFTGYAIQLLINRGLISLDDSISKYLEWFSVEYEQEPAEITIRDLLYQTSGIPFKTIANMPESQDDTALEKTVKTLIGTKLDEKPGKEFSYATINYDVLGLVIEKVTGLSYEDFIQKEVFMPLNMKHTYAYYDQAQQSNLMATGYKVGFLKPRPFKAPIYRGNTPAGYIITSSEDMVYWLESFMKLGELDDTQQAIVDSALAPNRRVPPLGDGTSYASGWFAYQLGQGEYAHGGGNPNFSAFMVVRPADKIGVVILTNIGGTDNFVDSIGLGIMDIIMDRDLTVAKSNMVAMDNALSLVFVIEILLSIGIIILIIKQGKKIIKDKTYNSGSISLRQVLKIMCIVVIAYVCVNRIPYVFYDGLNWEFLKIWGPTSLIVTLYSAVISAVIFVLYYLMQKSYSNNDNFPYFLLVSFSIISGIGNAFTIMMINTGIRTEDALKKGVFFYFVIGLGIYIMTQRFIRKKIIEIAKTKVYSIRMEIVDVLLDMSLENFESIEDGEISAVLNNDTEKLSEVPGVMVEALTALVTIIFSLIYLGSLNKYALFIIIGVIVILAGIYGVKSNKANEILERTRDIQESFFEYIKDLINGFKELRLSPNKKEEFREEVRKSSLEYKNRSILVEANFTDAFMIGETVFNTAIGVVVFIFPLIFYYIQEYELATFVFVLIYITGPIREVLSDIPRLLQLNVSNKRVNAILEKFKKVNEEDNSEDKGIYNQQYPVIDKIILNDIVYHYKDNQRFSLGPITYTFKSGELIFITGGNGSGKTTLLKLITGLYSPHGGTVEYYANGCKIESAIENISSVFCDFYLFKRLYGIKDEVIEQHGKEYLERFRLSEKVDIKENCFTTTSLSTGQRKRLALIKSCLEDKPIIIFDEVAADQDPTFKKYFYEEILKEIVDQNKIVIVITHDDHYYHLADRVVKLNEGRIDV